jgi:hypothetical protein
MARKYGHYTIPRLGCWIKHQLNLRNIPYKAVAQQANCSISMVSYFILGVKNSPKVGKALADMLGYATYKDLAEAASLQSKGGAA